MALPMLKTITTAMVLCAGFGKRMEDLSQTCPKPLLPLWGKPILDHLLFHLKSVGITRLVVNTHHLAEQFQTHLLAWKDQFAELHLSHEDALLGIAGGIRQALPLLGKTPFFVLNGDVIFNPQEARSLFLDMEQQWHSETACLLSVIPHAQAWGYTGPGDFFKDAQNNLTLKQKNDPAAPYVYGGVQILTPQFVSQTHTSSPHILPLWQTAQDNQKLKGAVWQGQWFHVGTKAAYEAIQKQKVEN